MDRGELFNQSFEVWPAENGSFVVKFRSYYDRDPQRGIQQRDVMGFSNAADLVLFFNDEFDAYRARGPQPPSSPTT